MSIKQWVIGSLAAAAFAGTALVTMGGKFPYPNNKCIRGFFQNPPFGAGVCSYTADPENPCVKTGGCNEKKPQLWIEGFCHPQEQFYCYLYMGAYPHQGQYLEQYCYFNGVDYCLCEARSLSPPDYFVAYGNDCE